MYDTFQKANNKGADQTARMRRLVCAFVVPKPQKTDFSRVEAQVKKIWSNHFITLHILYQTHSWIYENDPVITRLKQAGEPAILQSPQSYTNFRDIKAITNILTFFFYLCLLKK